MGVHFRSINSETDIKDTAAKYFRRCRAVDQTAFYQDSGAHLYYNPHKTFTQEEYAFDDIVQMMCAAGCDHEKYRGKKVAIVSLGCGSCEKDVHFVSQLRQCCHDIDFAFFGVDSSPSMLGRAHSVMQGQDRETRLISADFGSQKFQREFAQMMQGYDAKLLCLRGHTMGSLNQSYMIDVFHDFLGENDCLLVDVVGVDQLHNECEVRFFDRYEKYLSAPAEVDFLTYPLRQWGIDTSCGEVVLDMTKQSSVGALLFTFGFQIHERRDAIVRGAPVMLLPGEYIELYNLYVYDIARLVSFFAMSGLQVQGMHDNGLLKQFLVCKS